MELGCSCFGHLHQSKEKAAGRDIQKDNERDMVNAGPHFSLAPRSFTHFTGPERPIHSRRERERERGSTGRDPLGRPRHFKRPIGLAIAEPEVQVISLSDKERVWRLQPYGRCCHRAGRTGGCPASGKRNDYWQVSLMAMGFKLGRPNLSRIGVYTGRPMSGRFASH